MTLQLKNIGMIKEANVKIDGLTVIAGENSTGKSTIGKLLFSLIKSSSRYNEDLEEGKEEKILSLVRENYNELRKEVDFSENREYQRLFSTYSFSRDIRRYAQDAIDERLDFLKDTSLVNIEKNLQNIKKTLLEDSNIEEAQKSAFKKVLISEFKGKISTQNDLNQMTSIKINEGKNKVIDIELLNDEIQSFSLVDELSFSDATFIESPIVLQLSETVGTSKTYFEEFNFDDISRRMRSNVPLHIKDLDNKLKIASYEDDLFESEDSVNKLLLTLSSIIDGNFQYFRKEIDFKYTSKEGKIFDSLNTATGFKAFGIIQMLLKNSIINKTSLLILDEPEVHLHPKWQLKYAEMIVELVRNDINVLVSSHSPYMIQALIKYARDNEDITDKSNFYLAQKEEDYSTFENVNEDLNKIFELLAEPMNEVFEL